MAENPAFIGPQWPSLSDRLAGIGKRTPDSGYKTGIFTLGANTRRVHLRIQNDNNAALFLKFGGTQASATDYDVSLKAATGANDGSGGWIELWNNIDSVSIFSAGTYKFTVLEYAI